MHRKGDHGRGLPPLPRHLAQLTDQRPMARVHAIKKTDRGRQLAPIRQLLRVADRPHASSSVASFSVTGSSCIASRPSLANRRLVRLSRKLVR